MTRDGLATIRTSGSEEFRTYFLRLWPRRSAGPDRRRPLSRSSRRPWPWRTEAASGSTRPNFTGCGASCCSRRRTTPPGPRNASAPRWPSNGSRARRRSRGVSCCAACLAGEDCSCACGGDRAGLVGAASRGPHRGPSLRGPRGGGRRANLVAKAGRPGHTPATAPISHPPPGGPGEQSMPAGFLKRFPPGVRAPRAGSHHPEPRRSRTSM